MLIDFYFEYVNNLSRKSHKFQIDGFFSSHCRRNKILSFSANHHLTERTEFKNSCISINI